MQHRFSDAMAVTRFDLISALVFLCCFFLLLLAREYGLPHILSFSETAVVVHPLLYKRIETLFTILSILISASLASIVYLRFELENHARTLANDMMADLLASREQFRIMYESSPVPYFLMDDGGRIVNPNKAALRFFDGTMEQVGTINLFDQIGPDETSATLLPLLKSKAERGVPISRQEVPMKTLSGSMRWVLLSIFTLDKNAPFAQKRLVSIVDITQEKEIDKVKTEFVSLASHQLRTPLTTVKWYVDLLLTSSTLSISNQVRDYLQKIYVGNERMIDLVSTLLNVSRIEMGTVPVDIKDVSLNELLNDVLDEVSKEVEHKNLHLQVEPAPPITLQTDRALVRIVIQNLLTNAIRYTPPGGNITVALTLAPSAVTLSVEDTGCGIPPEAQSKLFSKMFRADNAKKIETKGTGLGLYMTKAFVEKLGGTISFTSKLNVGTVFTVSLPKQH